ncbi:MAG: small multi-drug export protein [Clostridia bacterium]|nr:small multi-drug export protein [Clostridia bacterium]
MEGLVNWFMETLKGLSGEWVAFIISMVPILELRGGLLAASLMNVPILTAVPLCIIGNIIPVPFILWFVTPLFNLLKKTRLFRPLVEKLEAKAMGKKDKIEKGYFWGLVLFVGIPLPGTGAWTGSLIASMLDIPFKKAFPAVLLGILVATIIMSLVSYGLLGAIMGLFA